MKVGTEDRKKLAIAAVAGVGGLAAVIYAYGQLFPTVPTATAPVAPVTSSPAPARATDGNAPSGSRAKVVATTAAALDPTLHMSSMLVTESLTYRGSGRNIFSANAAPVSIPKAISSARPKTLAVAYTPPSGPPPPPPIDLRFFGTATRTGQQPRAFLLRGEDVVLASVGDIVERRYKVVSITASTVTVEDLTNDRQQSLPLLTN